MPDEKRDVTRFTKYFSLNFPGISTLILILIIFGIISGILGEYILNPNSNIIYLLISGASLGITIIAFPGILTGLLFKAMKRSLKLKHALIVVLVITITYAAFFILSVFTYKFTNSYTLALIPILLSDAGIYGYWFIINKVVLNQRRTMVFTAALQPVLNALIFIPVSNILFAVNVSPMYVLVKLLAGIIAFMCCGYLILFIMDRPSKKLANFSGVEIMSAMIGQWLYGSKNNLKPLEKMGTTRDVPVSLLAFKSKNKYKAIFVKPNIHYGPIQGLGGSVTTELLGNRIKTTYGATPFILHGAVNIEDNPVNSSDVNIIWNLINKELKSKNNKYFETSFFSIKKANVDNCTALGIKLNSSILMTLTKAPLVTEDIDSDIGSNFESLPLKEGFNCILIDAHNSRFETADAQELKGIYKGSKYVSKYTDAILSVVRYFKTSKNEKLLFGSSSIKLKNYLKNYDIGPGYMSVAIFKSKKQNFCMVYFDSNNIAPKFRSNIIDYIKNRYQLTAELYSTDTHAVNTLALSASNVLGKFTKEKDLLPYLDKTIEQALASLEEVKQYQTVLTAKNFKVWGKGSEEAIMRASRQIIKRGKKAVPFIVVSFFIIAAWAIYLA
ncbi:MAG: DUF2070 family protein [Candidatus Micrarchaeaceae archaeon]